MRKKQADPLMRQAKSRLPLMIFILCLAAFAAFIVFDGRRNRKNTEYQTTGFTMGTVVTVTIYGENANEISDGLLQELDVLETETLSWRQEGSEVWTVNHNYEVDIPYNISKELAEYITITNHVSDASGGLLDITVRPLAEVWGIEDGKTEVPETAEIEQALTYVDYTQIHVNEIQETETVGASAYTLVIDKENISIDLGAVGKGIGCDRAAVYMETVQCTGGCVAIGGSIVVYGNKPDGSRWKVGIRNPRGEETEVMGMLSIDTQGGSRFISTSGDYEKYFIEDGKRYHHILNPQTGYPAHTGTISATVVCDSGILSDALSTACILLELPEAVALLDVFDAEGILIDEDRNVYVTEGIQTAFSIQTPEYKLAEIPD